MSERRRAEVELPELATVENRDDGAPYVKWADSPESDYWGGFFAYRHIATSPSGIEVVRCMDSGGGSGTIGSIGLPYLERDRGLRYRPNDRNGANRHILTLERAVIMARGFIPLGDRYDGQIVYDNGILSIGPDVG